VTGAILKLTAILATDVVGHSRPMLPVAAKRAALMGNVTASAYLRALASASICRPARASIGCRLLRICSPNCEVCELKRNGLSSGVSSGTKIWSRISIARARGYARLLVGSRGDLTRAAVRQLDSGSPG
jgi:hypothetical protein